MNEQGGERRIAVLDRMEHETVRVYDAALQKVTDSEVRQQLQTFRDDHQRRAEELDGIAAGLGIGAGDTSPGFQAFIDEHLQVIQQADTQDRALEGLLLIEEANLGEFRLSTREKMPTGGDGVLRRMLDEEQRDVSWIAGHMHPAVGIDFAARDAASGKGAWQMSEQECVVMCSGLRFMDEQTALALDSAADKVTDEAWQAQLQQFAEDHRRHVTDLDALLDPMGGSQLPTEELQQYLHEAVGVVDRSKGADDAMERLLLLERANAAEYESVARAQMPSDEAMQLVEKHHLDEQHHVQWIEQHSVIGSIYGTTSAPRVGEDVRGIGV